MIVVNVQDISGGHRWTEIVGEVFGGAQPRVDRGLTWRVNCN